MAYNRSIKDRDFFVVALKEEAREVLWKVGSSADPKDLVQSVLHELEALAPKNDGIEERSEQEIWEQVREVLLKAAYATRPYCVRCGTCCTKGSPVLSMEDLDMFRNNAIKPDDLVTIRQGEMTYDSRSGSSGPTDREMIKIREAPASKTCSFYRHADKSCAIYEHRPHQCRIQECWSPRPALDADVTSLTRQDLLQATGQLWEVILHHEKRCSTAEFGRTMARLAATKGQTVEDLIEMLKYDRHVREFIRERFSLSQEATDFFFGRPLSELLELHGLRVREQPDGAMLLDMIEGGA